MAVPLLLQLLMGPLQWPMVIPLGQEWQEAHLLDSQEQLLYTRSLCLLAGR